MLRSVKDSAPRISSGPETPDSPTLQADRRPSVRRGSRLLSRFRAFRRALWAAHVQKFRHVTVRNSTLSYRLGVLLRRGLHLAGTTAKALVSLSLPFVLPLLGCGIVAFSLWAGHTYSIALEVVVGEKVIGYVPDSGAFGEIQSQVESRVMDESEAETGEAAYMLEDIPFLRYTVIERASMTDESDIFNTLYALASDYTRRSYGFYLDGRLIATSRDKELLEDVLQTVLEAYTAGGENVQTEILNYIEVRRDEYSAGYERSYTRLLSLFTADPQGREDTVNPGDTPETVAARNGLDVPVLLLLNHLSPGAVLSEGQTLFVGSPTLTLNVKCVRTEVSGESIPFQTEYIYTEDLYEGETSVTQEGRNGRYEVVTEICTVNGVETSRVEVSRTLSQEPVPRTVLVGTKLIAPSGKFIWPTVGGYVSSGFGGRWLFGAWDVHTGMDIAVPFATPIYAADAGVVVSAGEDKYLGIHVKIDHGNGITTIYGHASSLAEGIVVGKKVYQGQLIAYVGSTGVATGNHVHFGVYDNQKKEYYDPAGYVQR